MHGESQDSDRFLVNTKVQSHVVCDPNTKQTLLLIGDCMDYNEEEDVVFIGGCPFINQKGVVDAEYVKPPKNASELKISFCVVS